MWKLLSLDLVKGDHTGGTLRIRGSLPIGPSWQDWHIKFGPISSLGVFRREAAVARRARGRLPVPWPVFSFAVPPYAVLCSRTIGGLGGSGLLDRAGPEQLLVSLAAALRSLTSSTIDPSPDSDRPAEDARSVERLRFRRLRGTLHPDHVGLADAQAEQMLAAEHCSKSRRVLVHGDLFLPNLVFDPSGELVGILDLGTMRMDCAMADISTVSWAVQITMGEVWESRFLKMLGMSDQDRDHLLQHRLTFDLGLTSRDPWGWIDAPRIAERRGRLMSAGETL